MHGSRKGEKGSAMMAEEETTQPSGEEQSEASEATKPWETAGFESADGMAKEFAKLKADLKKLKPKAQSASVYEKELEQLRADSEARKQAEMSELELAKDSLSKQQAEAEKLQQTIAEMKQSALYERIVNAELTGKSVEEADILRQMYAAVVANGFEDEDSLKELLKTVNEKWTAYSDSVGVKETRPEVGGGSRSQFAHSGQNKDGKALAEEYKRSGLQGMFKRRAGVTK